MRNTTILFALIFCCCANSYAQSNFIGSGISLQFDSSGVNYYDLDDQYNTLNFPVTFEAWVNPTSWDTYSPLFSTDSHTSGNYYGFYVRFDISGRLIFEIGNGAGGGFLHRRGKITSSSLPLDRWSHVAVVATSVTDIKFYFNGVLQPSVNTDGAATNSSILHNSNHANLGRYATVHASHEFAGQIDEARLWNLSRTESEIRTTMCKKLIGTETGLIGYWIADESYVSTTLEDMSPTGADGNLIGVGDKLTSGAPVGDASVYLYAGDYTGLNMNLNSPGGDKFKVNKIQNTPYGVHVYRVNSGPYSDVNLELYPGYYYGVFTADGATAAKYTAAYNYSFSNGVVDVLNETESTIWRRPDGSATFWGYVPATLNTTTDRLTKKNVTGRCEFIFNINENAGAKEGVQTNAAQIIVYPNPASEIIVIPNVKPDDRIRITDLAGQTIREVIYNGSGPDITIDVRDLYSGTYIATVYSAGEVSSVKFIVSGH